jgi:hypothetical protein
MVAPFNTTMPLNVTALEKVTIPLKNDWVWLDTIY